MRGSHDASLWEGSARRGRNRPRLEKRITPPSRALRWHGIEGGVPASGGPMQHAPTVLPRPEPHRKRVGAPGHTVGGDSAEGVRAGEGVPAPCPERRLLGEQKSPEDTAQRSGLHAAATGGRDQWEGGNDAVLSGVTGTVPYRPHTSGSRGPYNSEGRGEQKSAENGRRRKRREDARRQ